MIPATYSAFDAPDRFFLKRRLLNRWENGALKTQVTSEIVLNGMDKRYCYQWCGACAAITIGDHWPMLIRINYGIDGDV